MFATLLVVLPPEFTGGELLVRHKGREARIALQGDEPGEAQFAAFYDGCVHEVLPIIGGHRLTLVYDLCRGGRGQRPEPPTIPASAISSPNGCSSGHRGGGVAGRAARRPGGAASPAPR